MMIGISVGILLKKNMFLLVKSPFSSGLFLCVTALEMMRSGLSRFRRMPTDLIQLALSCALCVRFIYFWGPKLTNFSILTK